MNALNVGWQSGRRETPLNLPNARTFPDYPALVDVLLNLSQSPDWAGVTFLTPDEAAQIRACGVDASAGWWRCPRLPKSVVGTFWKLSHLSEEDNEGNVHRSLAQKMRACPPCRADGPAGKV
jgi:hypothetical protein